MAGLFQSSSLNSLVSGVEMTNGAVLAQNLSEFFAKFESCIPRQEHNAPILLQTWTEALTGKTQDDPDVPIVIDQITTAIRKLEFQIEDSHQLSADEKRAAYETLNQFKVLVSPSRFHEKSTQFRQFCSPSLRGRLSMIGKSLQPESTNGKSKAGSTEQLTSELHDLANIIGRSTIEYDTRLTLIRHVESMLMRLSSPEAACL